MLLGESDGQLIIVETSKKRLGCLDMCQHLAEGQFFTITNIICLHRMYNYILPYLCMLI